MLLVKNFTLYVDAELPEGMTVYFMKIILYDVATGLPVLSLKSFSQVGQEPVPLFMEYYKASIESILGGRDEAFVELRVGEVILDSSITITSVKPDSVSPETIKLTIYRVGGAPQDTGVVATATATVTVTEERTVTVVATPEATTLTLTTTVTRTKTFTSTRTETATVTTTVTTTAPGTAWGRETVTMTTTATRTAYTTVTTTATVAGAAIAARPAPSSEDTTPYLAASIIALITSIAAFVIAVKK
jgi:hypothetical protein